MIVEGDPATDYGVIAKRELTHTRSEQSFNRAIAWLDKCKQNHICSKRLPLKDYENDFQPWPTRLVDVSTFEDNHDVRLVDNAGPSTKYICLSYCW